MSRFERGGSCVFRIRAGSEYCIVIGAGVCRGSAMPNGDHPAIRLGNIRALGLGGWLVCVCVAGNAFGQTAAPTPLVRSAVELSPIPSLDLDVGEGDDALRQLRQTLITAGDERTALQAMATLVNLQRRRGDYTAGLAQAREGLERAQGLGDVRLEVEFLYLIGRIHWNLADYPRSIETHLGELKRVADLKDNALLARTHVALGLTYQRFGNKDDARTHFDIALTLAQAAGDRRQLASILNSLGNYFLGEGDFDRAGSLHRQALAIREELGPRRAIADSLTNVGLVSASTGDTVAALDYLQQALAIYEPLKLRRYLANTHRRLASVLREVGRTDEALAHLATANEIAENLGSAEVLAAIYEESARTHEARGEYELALADERKLAAANEEMRGGQDRQRMSELRAHYNAEQRELEITLLRRDQELKAGEIHRRRLQNVVLGIGLALGVVLFGGVILLQRVRMRAQRRLHEATESARERAQAADRLKSRLLMMASHDLKVPLSALNATADLVGRSSTDALTVKRLADIMRADTARLRSLVRDFLDAAAIEEGNLQLHTAEIDLAAVAKAAVDTLAPVASAKRNELIYTRPSTPLPLIEADPDRLRQVFDNLIGNAIKFTPAGGRIEVAFGEAAGWAFAEVRDNGPGLGPAEFAKIFAAQPQMSPTASGGDDSTGLGLVITRELLSLQGGRLEVQSQPGRGAVFRVLLPVVG